MKFLSRPTPDFTSYLNELFKWVEAAPVAWNPTLTFSTAGDLNVVYSTRVGYYIRFGSLLFYWFNIVTSTFTHTTAAGNAEITGLSHPAANINSVRNFGVLNYQGITPATALTDLVTHVNANTTTILITGSGSGVNLANITTADMPTAGSVILRGTGFYLKE